MIVLEGCDCAGKTTIAIELARRMVETGRLRRFEKYGLLPDWWDYHHMYVRSCEEWSIIDRFVVSEYVYGLLWRGGANKELTKRVKTVSQAMNDVSAVTVYVRPSIWVIEKRLKERGDPLVKIDDINHVYSWYDSYLARERCAVTNTPVVQVDGENVHEECDKIMDVYLELMENTKGA